MELYNKSCAPLTDTCKSQAKLT